MNRQIVDLFEGQNFGKLLVRVSVEPTNSEGSLLSWLEGFAQTAAITNRKTFFS